MADFIKNFSEEVENNKQTTVVDFTAGWCGPCQMFAPVFDEVSKKMDGVSFKKVDVDGQSEIAQDNGVMSVPTIVIFKEGKEVTRKSGYMNETEFSRWVQENN